jgi:predicted phosphodiesterase
MFPVLETALYLIALIRVRYSNTKLTTKFATIASLYVMISFCAASVALTESAFAFNITAAGDWGCNSNSKNTVSKMNSKGPEVVLGLGDYSYADTANCWFTIIDPIDGKMHISIGNHDDSSSTLLNQYLSHFGLSRQYHSFNYGNTHFLALSTEMTSSSTQYEFAKADLQKASQNSNIHWIIVFFHKPMYTSSGANSADTTMRSKYHPLFDQYNVDIVLYGHNHFYERSYPLKYNSANPGSPLKTTTATKLYDNIDGTIFATVGTGGQSLYSYSSKAPFIVSQYKGYGFMDLSIGSTTLAVKFYANSDGTIKDSFTINKSTSGSLAPPESSPDPAPPESSPDSNSLVDGILNKYLG